MTGDSWAYARLEDIATKVGSGATPRGGELAYKESGVPLIRSMNVVFFGFKRDGLAFIDEAQADALKGVEVYANDVLLNITGASIGRVTLAPADLQGARVNQHVCIIRPTEVIEARYLRAFLSSPQMQAAITEKNYGVTRPALTKEQILGFQIALAPLPEQKRIADKLDALLVRVDACRERLDRVPGILKRFRQTVLAAATSGNLTASWRQTNAAASWTYERADQLCEKVQSGGTPKEGFVSGSGVPFLKVYNIVNQRVDFDYRRQYVTSMIHETSLAKSRVKPGDVLMNIVGPPLGKVALVPPSAREWNINQAITLFRPGGRMSSEWIYIVLCDGANVRDILHETKGTVGQVNISLSQCRAFQFPVPSLEEQSEIVKRVGTLMEFASQVERRCRSARGLGDRLVASVLAAAFRGALVPQDPSDEPASELLARVRNLRSTDKAQPTARKPRANRSKSQ